MVSGGGAMHLNDALGRESRLTYICNHHEQASAMAAEGYARVTNQVGVACVTSGPGSINALNGGQFFDVRLDLLGLGLQAVGSHQFRHHQTQTHAAFGLDKAV